MPKLLLISFDAVGSDELSILSQQPNFQKLMKDGTVFKDMKTVFVSNTYPIHCSVATGVDPCYHGLCSNTLVNPAKSTFWNYDSRILKHKTLWKAAAEKGLSVGNVLWPVTGSCASIKWNIPEIAVPRGESQLKANLKSGSVWLQIIEFLRHKKLLDGVNQPQLDSFAIHCAQDIISKKNPDLFIIHLTIYDSMCHKYGRLSDESKFALHFLDDCLGVLIKECQKINKKVGDPEDSTQFVIFSDHAQLDVSKNINPNKILADKGFLSMHPVENTTFGNSASRINNWRCFFQYSGGSAFFFTAPTKGEKRSEEKGDKSENYRIGLSSSELRNLQDEILSLEGVERLLTEDELKESGFADCPFCGGAKFGIAAKEGWYFDEQHWEKATHGYTTMVPSNNSFTDFIPRPHYGTFCAVNKKDVTIQCKRVTDVTKLVASLLDLKMN
ncbi:MAG: hypothetical protein BKP49_02665 [Treponema sp. CETP13]|nr:MAG: hypothetical protein BKP49_02665 [Treponema sp. CETP13]